MDTAIASEAAFAVHDDAFLDVLGPAPRMERVVDTDAHEGPVYVADEDALYFTAVPRPGAGAPRVDIRRLALDGTRFPLEPARLSTVRADANAANGMTLGPDGRLVVCEQGSPTTPAAVTLVDRASGSVETMVDAVGGLPLNSPNDVVVRRDGTGWFTDPSYGHLQGFRPAPRLPDRVYRHDPGIGATSVVAEGFDKPNGLVFSPDERMLYVGDSGAIHAPGDYDAERPHHVVAFDVVDGMRLVGERLSAVIAPGFPDGMKVDAAGHLYVSSATGVQVFDPARGLIGEIAVPGGAVNFTFGGPERNVLFITTDDAIWAAGLGATGPQP
jgi:gluconolactonase